jgi:Undecaprenyl-phosphate galactose phosphotransferase WbaP
MATRAIASEFPVTTGQQCRPACMIACLLLGDVVSLAASGAIPVLSKLIQIKSVASSWHAYLALVPLLLLFLLVFSAIGLYSGISLGSPEELRRLTLSSVLVSLSLGVMTFSIRGTGSFFTITMLKAIVLSVILVPLTRVSLRLKFANVSWWGYPTVIFGDQAQGEAIINNLMADRGLGLKPVGFFSSDGIQSEVRGVPVVGEDELAELVLSLRGRAYAVVTDSFSSRKRLMAVLTCHRRYFSHILVVPAFAEFSCLWVKPKNLGGMLGLEVCQQVFMPSRRFLKRFMDLILTVILGLVLAPLLLLIAIAIKIDSRGPVLYRQRRIGRGGREFLAWKFRSMLTDADRTLQQYLEENPVFMEEWVASRKLKNDPRTTRLGRLLRRTSLDELPQLWNVIRGEMSLVGPRPIVQEEISRYGADYETYTWVMGGLTGLWQVSGRSETSYRKRIAYDRFYVHNWSVWLDICILFRTVSTVLSRVGAF